MIYVKTSLGAHAIKDRRATDISQAQRAALILFDGVRSASAVIESTSVLGVTRADIEKLLSLGLIAPADAAEAPAAKANPAPSAAAPSAPPSEEERIQRYKRAYPIATQITAQLGLRGFKLNLAVESAQGYEGLMELVPKIRAAVGDDRLRSLTAALEGH